MKLLVVSYILMLCGYAYVNSVTAYCLLLLLSAMSCFLILLFSNASWYAVLFYLIYVGGVYILFIFLSVSLPNSSNLSGSVNSYFLFYILLLVWELSSWASINVNMVDFSYLYCGNFSGFSYLFLCSFLLLAFFLVSFISSSKESFIR